VLGEHELLALCGVDHDKDTSRQYAVEPIGRVVAQEHDFAGADQSVPGALEQCLHFGVRQGAEERV
jgi:hypothetical protein